MLIDASDLPVNCSIASISCSGHGLCNELTGRCFCDAGFTGRSDIFNVEGFDCHLDERVLLGLWICLLILLVLVQVIILPKIRQRVVRHREIQERKRLNGESFPLWKNRSLMSLIVYSCVCSPGCVGLCLVNIFDKDQRLGIDFAATSLYAMGRSGFFGMASLFQPVLMSSFLSGSKTRSQAKIKKLIHLSETFSLLGFAFSFVAVLVPFLTIRNNKSAASVYSARVFITFTLMTALNSLIYGLQAAYLAYKAKCLLNNDETLDNVRQRIVSLELQGTFHATIQCIVYAFFTGFSFLWTRHNYLNPWSFATYPILALYIAWTGASNKKGSSSMVNKLGTSISRSMSNQSNMFVARPSHSKPGRKQKEVVPSFETDDDAEAAGIFSFQEYLEEVKTTKAQEEQQTQSSSDRRESYLSQASRDTLTDKFERNISRYHISTLKRNKDLDDDEFV